MNKRYDKPLTAEELAAMTDKDIDYSDIPELDEAFWAKAKVKALRAHLDEGIDQLDRGEGTDGKAFFDEMLGRKPDTE